jgi:hypothetical protein
MLSFFLKILFGKKSPIEKNLPKKLLDHHVKKLKKPLKKAKICPVDRFLVEAAFCLILMILSKRPFLGS